jgi:hypothetical protein
MHAFLTAGSKVCLPAFGGGGGGGGGYDGVVRMVGGLHCIAAM